MSYQVTKGMVFRPVTDIDNCFVYQCPQCDCYFMLEEPDITEDHETPYYCPYCRYEEDRIGFLMHANYEFFYHHANDLHSRLSFSRLYNEPNEYYTLYFKRDKRTDGNDDFEEYLSEKTLLSASDHQELNELFPSIYTNQEYQAIFYKRKPIDYFHEEICPYNDFKTIKPVCCDKVFKYRVDDLIYDLIDLIYCPYCNAEINRTSKL